MTLLVDADSCPKEARRLILKRALKEGALVVFAANRPIPLDAAFTAALTKRALFRMDICGSEDGAADERLAGLAEAGDIAVTRDVPLAERLLQKGASVLDDRGRIFTLDNIRYHLSIRNFNVALAENGAEIVRYARYGDAEKKAFAQSLDTLITRVRGRG